MKTNLERKFLANGSAWENDHRLVDLSISLNSRGSPPFKNEKYVSKQFEISQTNIP